MTPISFKRHRFSPVIIQHAVWLYARFTLSFRDVEDLLAERGLDVSYETVRRWVLATSTGHSAADFRYGGKADSGRSTPPADQIVRVLFQAGASMGAVFSSSLMAK